MGRNHLKEMWIELVDKFVDLPSISKETYKELEGFYTSENRAYHNLEHISQLLERVAMFKNELQNYDAVRFAIWFHDAIYDPIGKNNEELSAKFARKHMERLLLPEELIQKVVRLILATSNHMDQGEEVDTDFAFFLDFDLMILGSHENVYKTYSSQIRQEYKFIPDVLYKLGRKKILRRFLETHRIYKTDAFYFLFEKQARLNLEKEIDLL